MIETTEQRVSQLLMLGFQGPEPAEDAWSFFRETPPAGLLLFKHNIVSQEKLAETLRQLQAQCRRPGWPSLLVGIDQEGGRVVRLTGEVGFPTFPSALSLAAVPDPDSAVVEAAAATAEGLRTLGINMNFAPVLDVVTDPGNRVIGDRSFGSDPAIVQRLGLAVIRTLQEHGVAATAKHFPGHGPTAVDSHLDLPLIPLSRAELEEVHLQPFRAAVKEGIAAIMTAHAVYSCLDGDAPATLSRAILAGLLREEWGYEGVVVTDSLTMQAIARRLTVPEACIRAIEAGADLLMIPASPTLHRLCLQALVQALQDGRISESRLEESLRRTRQLREKYNVG